jgi:hypothetical protein
MVAFVPQQPPMPEVEGAPIITCRAWQEGDERRGLRGLPCAATGCLNTLAVSQVSFNTAETFGRSILLCERHSTAAGTNPNGRQMHADRYGEPPATGRDLAPPR